MKQLHNLFKMYLFFEASQLINQLFPDSFESDTHDFYEMEIIANYSNSTVTQLVKKQTCIVNWVRVYTVLSFFVFLFHNRK